MSITIDKPFSEWKPKAKREPNHWAWIAVLSVAVAFVCGLAAGYALRDPYGQIEKLRLAAEKADKAAKESREEAAAARLAVEQAYDKFGMGVSRPGVQATFERLLPEYKVNFADSTKTTGGVKSTTATIGDTAVVIQGSDRDIALIRVLLFGTRNSDLATSLLAIGFRIADPEWMSDEGDSSFNAMLKKTTTEHGCFMERGQRRVSAQVRKHEGENVLIVTFSPNQFERL